MAPAIRARGQWGGAQLADVEAVARSAAVTFCAFDDGSYRSSKTIAPDGEPSVISMRRNAPRRHPFATSWTCGRQPARPGRTPQSHPSPARLRWTARAAKLIRDLVTGQEEFVE